ncbi:MAG: damage-inducible protein DinB [Acidobacteria bacterium]|nr:MAG: damage-inducible protein DinB [Acidobacteriota bacterium]
MRMNEIFLGQLEAEAGRTRRALERMPEGRDDWKPHEKSMPFGRLAMLVAGMPSWLPMIINQDELDLNPPGGSNYSPSPLRTSAELVESLDKGTTAAREALRSTTEDHLMKPWRLLVAGKVVDEKPRHIVIRDTFAHLAHHRGQLTVYLRLNNAPVPAIYGPSADDARFE